MDLDSQPKPLSELISLVSLRISGGDSIEDSESEIISLIGETKSLNREPELISLIYQVLSLVNSIASASNLKELIFLYPQEEVILEQGKFHVVEQVPWRNNSKWRCFDERWQVFRQDRRGSFQFRCQNCNGQYHNEHNKAPAEIKHPLHPKHSLHLVLFQWKPSKETRKSYCCDNIISQVFYYCWACDIAINFDCTKDQPVLYIDRPKWHDHTLALFPSEASVTCNLCALVHATSCPFYTCTPCNFVVHEKCLSLPRVIKISRHPQHRISFKPSFVQGDWVCGVCRRKINTDYGGYSCIKDECLFAAHSKCATQSNVWDLIDLEGVPEEVEEEVGPVCDCKRRDHTTFQSSRSSFET
ncbi:unnamed protein product [Microthlaspi erraticum]|uniref:DC1 domain-containing protein n=1 Tax=Microthlaspi erraticum TaxID=1685480 RepID=A0A6D2HNZ5_9BRAS|nr:unnamed protein product [Microthlaspi erraticum]